MKRGTKVMIFIGIVFVLIGLILIYWNVPYSPYKSAFTKRMKSRLEKVEKTSEVCTKEEIEKLPVPLQRYCKFIGLENSPKHNAVHTLFKNTDFVFDSKSGKIIDMDYDLWLFYDKPYRSAFCTSSIKGIPFDGEDYCTDDKQGGMKGFLGKTVQIFDESNSQGYKAGLISWFAESLGINPSVMLSPYVTYETIDDCHVKATVNYNGVSGSGVITLNEEGAVIELYSDERQEEKVDGVMTKVGWLCEYKDYKMQDGLRRVNHVNCNKIFKDREFVYFNSDNFQVNYLK